ncbi:hypothetical protein EG68_02506 [Paragonimus skrjabini miyazakii]|uniref:Uncharacterized protein n=1 Tax=Paragonimus skrjabini miyazakii TaxID=59628 RepID=A0A8S9Z8Q8_9TREM|nr:hypothetical protein EG68_02506 [Paragonimus skrjabini miyazakii]
MSFSGPTPSGSNRPSTHDSTPNLNSAAGFGIDGRYDTVTNLAKRTLNIELPEAHSSANRSLFVFSENNLIRKAARSIIEWGYPFYE